MMLIASSAFVLAALTISGVYLRNQTNKAQNDGYTIDFTALESSAAKKSDEIAEAQNLTAGTWSSSRDEKSASRGTDSKASRGEGSTQADQKTADSVATGTSTVKSTFPSQLEDELDYMPLQEDMHTEEFAEIAEGGNDLPVELPAEEASSDLVFSFEGLIRPVSGEILMPYSMDAGIYFATLDQYKYNPAVIYQAAEDAEALVCAAGRVTDIYEDAETGRSVRLDLGDGYEAIYGQLKEIFVVENAIVAEGEAIGTIAAPTKYYSVEGSNLYFELKKDGVAVDPESLYR